MEQWKWIPGFDGYAASNLGRIRSHRPPNGRGPLVSVGRIRLPAIKKRNGKDHRLVISLRADAKAYYRTVTHLVLAAFVGERPDGSQACHKDDNCWNNKLDNLYWGTPKQNAEDRDRNGRTARGGGSPHAKLSDKEFALLAREKGDPKIIARKWGIHWATVYRARRGKRR